MGGPIRHSWNNGVVSDEGDVPTDHPGGPESGPVVGFSHEDLTSVAGIHQLASHLDLEYVRLTYGKDTLTEDNIAPTWPVQLLAWYAAASAHPDIVEPNAMQVATVDADGRPDVRTLLARGVDERGVVFYTNYDSAKGRALDAHPYASGLFFWQVMERQIRFRGPVTKVSAEETAAYFATRPRGAQLGAWTSHQSAVVSGRDELERDYAAVEARFADVEQIPVPPHWGGYRIGVDEIEFWQGRQFRLHDRLRFRRTAGPDGEWVLERLSP